MHAFPPRIRAFGLPATAPSTHRDRLPEIGEDPDTRTPGRFLIWFLRQQWVLVAINAALSVLWFAGSAVNPLLLGKAIDQGIRQRDLAVTLGWAAVMFCSVTVSVIAGVSMHTAAVASWVASIYRTIGLVSRRALSMGHVLPRRTPTGEVLSVAGSDGDTFGAFAECVARVIGALLAFIFVSVVILEQSTALGLTVLIGAPILLASAVPLLRPLQRARAKERGRSSELTGMATDIVAGLRILRGVGGEQTFGDNYAAQSQRVREAGVEAGTWQAGVDGLSVLLSGSLLVVLTYLGVSEVLAGQISVGQMVSFFGYALFMVWPLSNVFEFVQKLIQARVAARKTITVLGQSAPWKQAENPVPFPAGARIDDDQSGFVAHPGRFTVVVSAVPDDSAALADRIGRYLTGNEDPISHDIDESLKGRAARRARLDKDVELAELSRTDAEIAAREWGVRYDGIDASTFDLDEFRSRVLVSDTGAMIFAGTMQQLIDPHGRASREVAEEALRVANAEEVFDALPGGWQGRIDERGRGLSGGQRQRLVLARALVADPEVLVLVEPTSAVDAHTEARIATRLAEARRGRTTIVTTVSPLVLHVADEVVLMVDGRCVERGSHHDLMENSTAYRAVVERGSEDN